MHLKQVGLMSKGYTRPSAFGTGIHGGISLASPLLYSSHVAGPALQPDPDPPRASERRMESKTRGNRDRGKLPSHPDPYAPERGHQPRPPFRSRRLRPETRQNDSLDHSRVQRAKAQRRNL